MVGLQTLDLAIGVRVPASQPTEGSKQEAGRSICSCSCSCSCLLLLLLSLPTFLYTNESNVARYLSRLQKH